jgi:hypothetical protein
MDVAGNALASDFVLAFVTTIPSPPPPPPTPNVLDSASYAILLVNDKPLPVASPWGVGIWDYDEDAGTWQLIAATLTLKTNGTFANAVTHRAASGKTLKNVYAGTYTRSSSGSIRFLEDGPFGVDAYSAQINGNRLVITFSDGGTFMFEELR